MSKPDPQKRGPRAEEHPLECAVGKRIRQARILNGLSQEKLARSLGITFQQVQKIERGANRISVGRLYRIAQVFDYPVSWFYDDLQTVEASYADPEWPRKTLEHVRHFMDLPDTIQSRVYELTRELANDA